MILVVAGTAELRDAACAKLRSLGLTAEGYESAEDLASRCDLTRPGCMLLDPKLTRDTQLQHELAARGVALPIFDASLLESIQCAFQVDRVERLSALQMRRFSPRERRMMELLDKSTSMIAHELGVGRKTVQARVSRIMEKSRDALTHSDLIRNRLVGPSAVMRRLIDEIETAANSSAPVLILGEPGTRHDMWARGIHARGPRCGRALVRYQTVGAIPELMEGDLFGALDHGHGTGDIHGLFETTDGGAVFIEDVDLLPVHVQARLMRTMQLGEGRPIGGDELYKADVRVIASSQKELNDPASRAGKFREDLFAQLSALSVSLPPLREHLEDIPALVDQMLSEASAEYGTKFECSPQTPALLMRYSWPGNLRELESVVARACILAASESRSVVELSDLPEYIGRS